MSKMVITGGNGRIGSLLRGSSEFATTNFLDIADCDLRIDGSLDSHLEKNCTLVHLAWKSVHGFGLNSDSDIAVPNLGSSQGRYRDDVVDLDNFMITTNVFASAARMKVKRVIVASSVHADTPSVSGGLARTDTVPVPASLYGTIKCFVESIGRYYASTGMEVVVIRFGGVNPEDQRPPETTISARRWLSHRDCISAIKASVDADVVPNNYSCFYAISSHSLGYHDVSNPFGWKPAASLGLQ